MRIEGNTKSKKARLACHVTYFSNFGNLLISLERLRIQTINFACTLIVTEKWNIGQKGAWP